jgi:hypothetical protein
MPPQVQRKLLIACILCTCFMIVEVVGGYFAHRSVTFGPGPPIMLPPARLAFSCASAYGSSAKGACLRRS